MRDQYEAWNHSSHNEVATCNDCHGTHDFLGKWYVKARNGIHHSMAFTLSDYEGPLHIKEFNSEVVQENCERCHQEAVSLLYAYYPEEELDCTKCHGNVGHRNKLGD